MLMSIPGRHLLETNDFGWGGEGKGFQSAGKQKTIRWPLPFYLSYKKIKLKTRIKECLCQKRQKNLKDDSKSREKTTPNFAPKF